MAPQNNRARGGRGAGRGRGTTTDRDGDVRMGAAPSLSSSRGRGGVSKATKAKSTTRPNGPPGKLQRTTEQLTRHGAHLSASKNHQISTSRSHPHSHSKAEQNKKRFNQGYDILSVKGLSEVSVASQTNNGIASDLRSYLERRSSNKGKGDKVIIHSASLQGPDECLVEVLPKDRSRILKMNGNKFAGATLSITIQKKAGQLSENGSALKAAWQTLLDSRYNTETKTLDLSNVRADGLFVSWSDAERQKAFSSKDFFHSLFIVASEAFKSGAEKRDKVHNISLAQNDIAYISEIKELSIYFPHLQGLDLSGNRLTKASTFQVWRRKLRALGLLLVANNPFTLGPDQNWIQDLTKWFPALYKLDGTQVRSEEEAAAASSLHAIDRRIKEAHIHDDTGTVVQFVRNIILGFDNDRPGLIAAYYDQKSTFVLSDVILDRSTFDPYVKKSRNLKKISTPPARMDRTFKGPEQITAAWDSIPPTQHPDLDSEIDEWCIESQNAPNVNGSGSGNTNGHFINIHGKFTDLINGETRERSFDRSLIIVPGDGLDGIRVKSDQLTIRDLTSPRAFKPKQTLSSSSPPPQAAQSDDMQQFYIQELMKATGLNAQYAKMCLESVGWDTEKVMGAFEMTKPNLGPEAYV